MKHDLKPFWPFSVKISIHVGIQVQLGTQVEVEESVNTQQEEQNRHDHQDDILQQKAQEWNWKKKAENSSPVRTNITEMRAGWIEAAHS